MSTYQVGEFGSKDYWEDRYRQQEGTAFEWYCGSEALQLLLAFKKRGSLLEMGCGNSELAEAAVQLGYTPVLATDISQVVIDQCRRRVVNTDALQYAVMDCCKMELPSSSWDIVLDKGTLDALDCAGRTSDVLAEVDRVLKPGGFYLLISCREPHDRLAALDKRFQIKERRELWASKSDPCPNAFVFLFEKPDLTRHSDRVQH